MPGRFTVSGCRATHSTLTVPLSLRPRIRLGAGELPGIRNKHSIQGVQLSLSLNAAHCGSKSSGSSHEAILQITPRIQSTTKSIFTADLYSCWVKLVHSFFLVTFPQHKAPLYNLFFLFEILPQNTDPNRARLSILPLTQEKYHNFTRQLFKYQLHHAHSLRLNSHQQLTLLSTCIAQSLIVRKGVFSLLVKQTSNQTEEDLTIFCLLSREDVITIFTVVTAEHCVN